MILIVILLGTIYFCSFYVSHVTKHKLYSSVSEIPHNRVGMVLGTAKSLKSGIPNPYFVNRIQAAAELYHAGKVDRLVISGDNGEEYYNEHQDMKEALMAEGVEEKHLYIDAAGFRTLDSMVRMKEVFGQTKFTVISQQFHNERSIYLAQHFDMDVVGFNAEDIPLSLGFKVQMREKLARVKVFIDLIFNKQPRFLGDPIIIQ